MLCHALKAIYMLKRDLLVVICSIRITTRSMICFLKKSCIVHSIFFFFSFSRALTLRSARIAISCWCLGKQSKLRHVNWNQSCSVDLCKCKCAAVSDNSKLRHVWNKHQVQGLSIVRNIYVQWRNLKIITIFIQCTAVREILSMEVQKTAWCESDTIWLYFFVNKILIRE